MIFDRAYYDSIAGIYGSFWTIEREIRAAAASLELDGDLLEIACGNGILLESLGPRAVGLDSSRGMIRAARERLPKARLVLATAESLPLRSGTFDFALAINIAGTLADPISPLREAARVAREGVILEMRNALNPVVALGRGMRSEPFTRKRFEMMLMDAGLTATEFIPVRRPFSRSVPGTGLIGRLGAMAAAFVSRIPGCAPYYVVIARPSGGCTLRAAPIPSG